jgi:hypothetical protein
MNNFRDTSIDDPHLAKFRASGIADDIAKLNFRSWNRENENDLDEVFTLLIDDPQYRNNGTLAGRSQNDLANTLRSGGWIFEGHKGVSVKPDLPRKDAEGKAIDLNYSSLNPKIENFGNGSSRLSSPSLSLKVQRNLPH